MSRKIMGVTVGTPTSPRKIGDVLKPVKTVNGVAPDANGNVIVAVSEGDGSSYPSDISISDIEGGYRLTISDKNGTKTIDVLHGSDGRDGEDGYTPQKNVDYFDGKDGEDGEDGYTPIKGVDYFDGKDGEDGKDGNDGSSITITRVTETDVSGGENTVAFSDGTSLAVRNGRDGEDGYTPEKGVDYFTESDKNELVDMVLDALPAAEGGSF